MLAFPDVKRFRLAYIHKTTNSYKSVCKRTISINKHAHKYSDYDDKSLSYWLNSLVCLKKNVKTLKI